MDDAIARAQANQGALGMTCNTLMLDKALFGRLPTNPPAPLEDVIDASVKTGADLSAVVGWNYEHSRELLETGVPIPSLLHNRLSVERDLPPEERPPRPRFTQDHWLDRLEDGIRSHIEKIRAIRDETSASARPPDLTLRRCICRYRSAATGPCAQQPRRCGAEDGDGRPDTVRPPA